MELRQLEYFVAVAAERNFTHAAAKLHVAQPGVSAQIRQLERELGQPLLDRSGRVTTLTEAGKAVLPFARAALGAVAGARVAVDELAGLLRGHVAVGMVVQCASLDLPELLARFHRRYPAIEITLTEDNSARLIERVREGSYDLAFIGLGDQDPPGLALHVVVDEPIVAVASVSELHGPPGCEGPAGAFRPGDATGGSVAGGGSGGLVSTPQENTVRLADLADRTLIGLPRGTGLRTAVEDGFAAVGVPLHVAFEASDPRTLARLAARGLGTAFIPASVAALHGGDLHVMSIRDPEVRARLGLVWRTEDSVSPAARVLISEARAMFPAPLTRA
jgi:DNA-binding transcriptional LysR family regulator